MKLLFLLHTNKSEHDVTLETLELLIKLITHNYKESRVVIYTAESIFYSRNYNFPKQASCVHSFRIMKVNEIYYNVPYEEVVNIDQSKSMLQERRFFLKY